MSSSNNPSSNNNDLVSKIQLSLQYHKRGDFNNAIITYEEIIPLVTGKIQTQICNNAGAIYLQQGSSLILFSLTHLFFDLI